MTGVMVVQGRELSAEDIGQLQGLMAEHPDWGRTRLSEELCRRWDWCNAQGRPKDMAEPSQLTIHADRGSSMTSKPVAFLLSDLGITKTHSRPHVSNDNPYSESQFRTMKYRPSFPDRFGSIQDARAFAVNFFRWYNEDHHHSGISLLTPSALHHGQAPVIIEKRQAVLDAAYIVHPERFVRRPPKSPQAPTKVWINKPATPMDDTQ